MSLIARTKPKDAWLFLSRLSHNMHIFPPFFFSLSMSYLSQLHARVQQVAESEPSAAVGRRRVQRVARKHVDALEIDTPS